MTKRESITDQGSPSKYFHQMLNMADDDLNPYEYRLLGHYRRVCGEGKDGHCWEAVRTTAKITRMSVGKVVSTRQRLSELGYIKILEPGNETQTTVIVVLDRMPENVARYYIERSPHEQSVHHMNASVHQVNERITIEEEPIKKEPMSANADGAGKEISKSTRKANPLFDIVALNSFGVANVNGDKIAGARIGKIAAWLGKLDPKPTPDEVEAFYKFYSREYPDTSYPKDASKFAEHFLSFRADAKKREESAAEHERQLREYNERHGIKENGG